MIIKNYNGPRDGDLTGYIAIVFCKPRQDRKVATVAEI